MMSDCIIPGCGGPQRVCNLPKWPTRTNSQETWHDRKQKIEKNWNSTMTLSLHVKTFLTDGTWIRFLAMGRCCKIENNFGSNIFCAQHCADQHAYSYCELIPKFSRSFGAHTLTQEMRTFRHHWFGFRTGHQTSPWWRGDHLSVNEAVLEIPFGSWSDMNSVLRGRNGASLEATQTSETNLREWLHFFLRRMSPQKHLWWRVLADQPEAFH